MIKTIPKKKKCKNAKQLSEEALQTAEKRGEAKGKGEKERYTHLNAEFQRIARRDKKAFLRDQCREIQENNRMGKIRDLFKKIRRHMRGSLSSPSYLVRNRTLAPQLGKTHRHREIGDFFSCLTWRAIPGLFSKLHRRLYSL